MAPIFTELSKKYTDLVFLKVDVDEVQVRSQHLQFPSFSHRFLQSSAKVVQSQSFDISHYVIYRTSTSIVSILN